MNDRELLHNSEPWWVRQVTPTLAIELWLGDRPYIRLVSSSYPVQVAADDLEKLTSAIQGAIDALAHAANIELDPGDLVIDLTPHSSDVVIDLTPRPTETVINQTGVVIDQDSVVIDQAKGLECDICGQPAIVVIDDSDHTTLCDDCYDGYFREQPSWTVEEFLKRQKTRSINSDDVTA